MCGCSRPPQTAAPAGSALEREPVVTIPMPAGSYYPDDVAVLSPTDAWVVGPQQPCTGTGAAEVCPTTLYHWDGSSWSRSPFP